MVVVVGILAVIAAVLYGAFTAFGTPQPRQALSSNTPAALPGFADSRPVGEHTVLEMRSAETGSVTVRLKSFGSSFTNNGLALSPNGQRLFFTLIPHTTQRVVNLLIEEISTITKTRKVIAHGELPAGSPDGRQLAYVTGTSARSVAIRDLSTGRTRSIDLTRLVGNHADGRQVAIFRRAFEVDQAAEKARARLRELRVTPEPEA